MDKCAAIGPRGGKCTRNAQRVDGLSFHLQVDFCSRHNQMVREGHEVACSKCEAAILDAFNSLYRIDELEAGE